MEASKPELNISYDKDSFGPGETAGIDGTRNSEGTTTVELTVIGTVEDGEVSALCVGLNLVFSKTQARERP